MQTDIVRQHYNTKLSINETPYEAMRWKQSPQAEAGYQSTKRAIHAHVVPLLKQVRSLFELGPGPATWTKELIENGNLAEITLVDISSEMLAQAKKALEGVSGINVSYTVTDILDYHPATEHDFFFSSRMLEYVPDKSAALQNIISGLRTGAYGAIITKTPQYGRVGSRQPQREIHKHQIEPQELVQVLQRHGAEVILLKHATCVVPKLQSGLADGVVNWLARFLPFSFLRYMSESYIVVFKKR